MKKFVQIATAILLLTSALLPVSVSFRFSDSGDQTRIVFEGSEKFEYKIIPFNDRIEIIASTKVEYRADPAAAAAIADSQLVAGVSNETRDGQSVLKVSFKSGYRVLRHFVLDSPFRLVFDLERAAKPASTPEPQAPPRETQSTATPQPPPGPTREAPPPAPTASKKKPIETICIDSGHGGEDLGAVGKGKTLEKTVTLSLGRKLKKLVEQKLGLRVIMTREKDDEVSLNNRASIANNQQAQMFISIHANSSFRRTAFGSETYYVSLNATDQDALELAQKENRSSENIGEEIQNDELKLILWNMAQTEYIKESSKLAELIQLELNELLGTANRGVKQAPFRVLMRSAMPSVLIEVAFLSNRTEEKKLTSDGFQDEVVLAIFSGISKFIAYYNSTLK